MTAARDRSGLAVAEIGAAGLLITSFSLPWFAVTYLNSAGVANGAGVTSISWADYRDYGQTLTNLLIPLGAMAAATTALVGLALPGRREVMATLVAFAIAAVGAISQLSEINSGSMDPPGFSTTNASLGLWLFAGAATLGASLALVDLARAGSSTFVWKALGEPSMKRYGLLYAYAGVAAIALVVVLDPMLPRWWLLVLFALLVGLALRVGVRRAK